MMRLALMLGGVLLAGRSVEAFGPLGTEFQVNTYTPDSQGWYSTAVAATPAGDFVVVWDSKYQDGDEYGVFGQRFSPSGVPLGPEFQVNTYTTGSQGGSLALAPDPAGNFVVVWGGQGAGDFQGVFAQRFDGAGNPAGGEFQVNTYTTGNQGRYFSGVGVVKDPTGNFVVVWGGAGAGDSTGVFGRRFMNDGTPLGGEFRVNTYTTGDQGSFRGGPSVAIDANGNFVVVWASQNQDGSGSGVFGQRYNSAGNPVGGEFQVNAYTTGDQGQRSIAVASDASGKFLVAWNHYWPYPNPARSDVFARLFDSAGNPLGGDFQVNTYTTGSQGYGTFRDASYGGIAAAADPAGDFLVAWDSDYDAQQDGDGYAVVARHYDGAGNPIGGEFIVNTYTTYDQYNISAAADGSGRFIVAWCSNRQDGQYNGVFAQRFGEPAPPAQLILGKRFQVRNPNSEGLEDKRAVTVVAREIPTDITSIDGDPTVNGAMLRVVANGTVNSDQTFVLDAAGWIPTRDGFRYVGPTGADGDPVKRVSIGLSRTGEMLLKADIKGKIGTQLLAVVPPNTGSTGGAIFTINGGGTYCVSFGGAAGGVEVRDDAKTWKIQDATAQPGCPAS